jgi:hypothetical protein
VQSFLQRFSAAFLVRLRLPGHARASRGFQKQRGEFRGGVGSLAALAVAPHRGKVVRVMAVERQIDVSAVSASIDTDPTITAPKLGQLIHCWHAARVHHRCRCFGSAESCCERWGSLLHQLFDTDNSLGAGRLVNRLHLREAKVQCIGGARDENLVAAISRIMIDVLRKNPSLRPDAARKRQRRGVDSSSSSFAVHQAARAGDAALAISGRGVAVATAYNDDSDEDAALACLQSHFQTIAARIEGERDEFRTVHCPVSLDSETRRALQRASRPGSERSAVLEGLPLFREDARQVHKDRGRAALRETLEAWLETKDAAEWRQQRQALWNVPA